MFLWLQGAYLLFQCFLIVVPVIDLRIFILFCRQGINTYLAGTMKKYTLIFFLLLLCHIAQAQYPKLVPGFNKLEYIELLKISALQRDTPWTYKNVPPPELSHLIYRSPVMGLRNRWDLWLRKDNVGIISIRGTTAEAESWLENFYLAMVPASGSVKISDSHTFDYNLATHPQAAVHLGWLIGLACLQQDIVSKIDSLYETGVTDFIITGHSQGGAIACLLVSHLANLQRNERMPQDINFKTYTSGAPKPGNIYYAYDYESITQNGKAFNVVNTADWVPETPASIQNKNDFALINPFTNAEKIFDKLKFPKNVFLKHQYKRLTKPTEKVRRRYQRFFKKYLYKEIHKILPGYEQPPFYNSLNYQRTGVTIVLVPDEEYFRIFKNNSDNLFVHHFIEPYLYLAKRLNY